MSDIFHESKAWVYDPMEDWMFAARGICADHEKTLTAPVTKEDVAELHEIITDEEHLALSGLAGDALKLAS